MTRDEKIIRNKVGVLELAKADKEAHGEFDSACPGYCGAQGPSMSAR